jgi:hypothetical protein
MSVTIGIAKIHPLKLSAENSHYKNKKIAAYRGRIFDKASQRGWLFFKIK